MWPVNALGLELRYWRCLQVFCRYEQGLSKLLSSSGDARIGKDVQDRKFLHHL